MSLLGFDSTGTATINGLNNIYCETLYSDDTYINNSTNPINVGDALDTLQAEIDALTAEIVGISQGNYFIGASSNNPNNTLSEKKLYFNQQPASYNFTLVGSGTSATQIRADASGVYNIWYKINYQKIDATTSYEVRTWIMKNGVDVDYTTTIQTMSTQAQWMQVVNQYTLTLNQNDYVEIVWLSANANASSDILDFIAASSPYPQVSSQTVLVTQVSNTSIGRSDEIAVGTTTTLAAGSAATVTDVTTTFPTYTLHTLDFGIPKGDQGNDGPQGPTGPQGPQGPKGEKGDAGDGPIAISALAIATAASAGLAAYIVSNNASQAVQDATIAGLAGDIASDEARILALEVKTDDISWGSLTGTTFSRQVHINNTGAAVGSDAIYLNSSGAATFLYGLSSSDNISTTSTFTSTGGTSQMSSLLVNNNFEVTNDATITAGEMYITRTTLASQKKLVLYDNNVGNDYDYLGLWTNSSNAFNFEGMSGGTYNWYFGNGLGTARSLAKTLSLSAEESYQATSTFLKSVGATQQIQLIRDTPNNKVRIDMIGDTSSIVDYDGQIIQEQGNGVDDNTGIMTIQTGDIIINALTSATTGTLQMNAKVLDINATGAVTLDTTSTITTTSTGLTTINSAGLDINAGAGNITVDTTGTIAIVTNGDMTFQTSNPFGDILISSAATTTLTSVDNTTINTVALDINATGAVTLDTTSTAAITSTGAMTLTSSGTSQINSVALDINATGAVTIDTTSTITTTSAGETEINCVAFDLNAGAGAITLDTTSTSAITSTGAMTLTTSGTFQTNCGAYDINATGNVTFDTTGSMAFTNGFGTTLTSSGLTLATSGGTFPISSTKPISITTTTIGDDITLQAAGQLNFTSQVTGATDAIEISTATSGYDMLLNNTARTDFQIRSNDNLIISTPTNKTATISTFDGDITLEATDAGSINLTANTGNISIAGTNSSDVNISGGDVSITTTGTTNGNISINSTNSIIQIQTNSTNRIEISNAGTVTISGVTDFNNVVRLNHDVRIQQNSYTQPMASTSQLGYTNTETTFTDPMSNTLTARSDFSLPSKGVWLIICGYEWGTNSANTVEAKEIILSTTSGGSTPAAYGLEYYEEINDGAGAAGLRQVGTLTGVVSVTAATTIYVNARSQISSGTNTELRTNVSWTRIG